MVLALRDRVKELTTTTKSFIKNSILKHGDKYCYAKVNYISSRTKVLISCKKHGEFLQTPDSHLSGKGCKKCGHEYVVSLKKKTFEKFVEEAKVLYGDKYTYNKDLYINVNTKMEIYCNVCKIFINQYPVNHLKGHGCRFCGRLSGAKKDRLSKDQFINKSILVHGHRYDYTSSDYKGTLNPVLIKCNDHNVEFYQTPASHFRGNTGCLECSNNESRGEKAIRIWLEKNKIGYEREKSFDGFCGNRGNKFRFDFWIESKNLLIEFDGELHFKESKKWYGKNSKNELLNIQKRDNIKSRWAIDNGYDLLRISYFEYKNIDTILNKKLLGAERV
jgi:very-short-patch-repair endonuclease